MRIWNQIDPSLLCRQHLLGEHRELHAIWSILIKQYRGEEAGYTEHPEVKRWVGYELALRCRHVRQVEVFFTRGFNHHSPLPHPPWGRSAHRGDPPPYDVQIEKLKAKNCECRVQ